MLKLAVVSVLILSGCTCVSYNEHSNLGNDVIKKTISYCSSKDMSGLRIEYGGNIIELDKADNQVGEVIEKLADKVPAALLFP